MFFRSPSCAAPREFAATLRSCCYVIVAITCCFCCDRKGRLVGDTLDRGEHAEKRHLGDQGNFGPVHRNASSASKVGVIIEQLQPLESGIPVTMCAPIGGIASPGDLCVL